MSNDPDFRFYASFRDHAKRVQLEQEIGARGVLGLIDLWCWVTATRQQGDLSGLSDDAIERGAGWRGKRGALVQALVAHGWLDGRPGAYIVHGWEEHQGWLKSSPARSMAGKVAAIVKQSRKHGVTTDQWLDDVGGEDSKNTALRERARIAAAPKKESTNRSTNRSGIVERNPTFVSTPSPYPSPSPTPSPTGGGDDGEAASRPTSPSGSVAAPPRGGSGSRVAPLEPCVDCHRVPRAPGRALCASCISTGEHPREAKPAAAETIPEAPGRGYSLPPSVQPCRPRSAPSLTRRRPRRF